MIDLLCPPLASNLWTMLFMFRVAVLPMVCPRHEYKVVFGSFLSCTKPRRNVHAIISYAMYCLLSFRARLVFCVYLYFGPHPCYWLWLEGLFSLHVYFFVVYTPYQSSTYELQHGRKCFTCLLCWLAIISWIWTQTNTVNNKMLANVNCIHHVTNLGMC